MSAYCLSTASWSRSSLCPATMTVFARWRRRVLDRGEPVRGAIESMTGARFVHDTLERYGWDALIADAQKVNTMHALRHPAYNERYQRNRQRLGKQRGAKVAQIDIARKLTEAIWHMLTRNEPFAPAPGGATLRLAQGLVGRVAERAAYRAPSAGAVSPGGSACPRVSADRSGARRCRSRPSAPPCATPRGARRLGAL
jgi:hypothetical protein